MSRYLECDEGLVQVFLDTIESDYPGLAFLNFKLVYDTKKRIKKGKIVLADIELASAKLKFFSVDDQAVEGYDYVVFVDRLCWEYANEVQRKRLISRQLANVFVDDKGKPKLVNFDIEDFYTEIQKNTEDPEWFLDLSQLTGDLYEQQADNDKLN